MQVGVPSTGLIGKRTPPTPATGGGYSRERGYSSSSSLLCSSSSSPAADVAIPAAVDVAVVGAGVIGLSIAGRLALRGLSVAVFERATAGAGASLAATGMLAAAAEHETGCHDLLTLALESQQQWPQFRAALEAQSGYDIDFRESGTLVVALGRDEVERLRFRHELHKRCGLDTRWLSGPEVRGMEPGLRPSVAAGLYCADDHQVDPRQVMAALCAAHTAAGGRLLERCAVSAVDLEGGRVAGLITAVGRCRASTVVLAAGAWTGNVLPPGITVPVRPLKGQALAVRATPETGTLAHIVWTEQIHLAPKGDGRLIIGATVEERGFDDAITAGGLYALLEGARRAFPAVEEMAIDAVWTGLRPSSIDDAPILGETSIPGLVLATGHHRNGYLLTPATAFAMEALIVDGALPAVARPFGLDRFGYAAGHRETEYADGISR
ncbi:MAG TPA: glycine oxidase ThiO [Xanthobacteraceae bacterium]|nr:glycine oxidase ThiO [Xanthobacteraceae bacterium]